MYLKPSAEVQILEMEELVASSPTLGYKSDETADPSFGALSNRRRSSWKKGWE